MTRRIPPTHAAAIIQAAEKGDLDYLRAALDHATIPSFLDQALAQVARDGWMEALGLLMPRATPAGLQQAMCDAAAAGGMACLRALSAASADPAHHTVALHYAASFEQSSAIAYLAPRADLDAFTQACIDDAFAGVDLVSAHLAPHQLRLIDQALPDAPLPALRQRLAAIDQAQQLDRQTPAAPIGLAPRRI